MAYYQAKGLSDLGHEIILFAARGSIRENYELVEVGAGDTVVGSTSHLPIPARRGESGLKSFFESSRLLRKENVNLAQVMEKLIEKKENYDIILNNMRGEAVFLPVAKLLNKLFVNVMHLPIFTELADIFKGFNTPIITISNSQRLEFPDLYYLATVYNCVDREKFKFNEKAGDYLLMMGSITPHKNQAAAIRIAKKLGMGLIIAGKIGDKEYFDQLKPEIDGKQIAWSGELDFPSKLQLYQNAKAFIFPITWPEPFGLVMIEAMACGTPVVAYGNGAIPEVVVDGKTGFVIENSNLKSQNSKLNIPISGEDGLIEAVKRINDMSEEDYRVLRYNCRKHVEENFTIEKMVKAYEAALLQIS